jgi:histidine ammonia-lyase
MRTVQLGEGWTLEDLADVAYGRAELAFGAAARARVEAARRVVDRLAEAGDEAPNVYGVNTGFGALAETRIAADQIRALQRNLVRSHACGVGEPLPTPAVRAMIALRAQTLALGCSGARPALVEQLVALLTRDRKSVV